MACAPVLFLIFNRPDLTSRVFEKIREAKPEKLYVAADGPRQSRENEDVLCSKARAIVLNGIDWKCEIKTLFRDSNLGCKVGVSSAITWFFQQEEEGIILEDDILPDTSFFEFCKQMLQTYRNDERIMHITGFNVHGLWKQNEQAYHAAYFGSIWGWASWRRAWDYYDLEIKAWGEKSTRDRILSTYFPNKMWAERSALYDSLFVGKVNTWDYQWTFSRLKLGGLSIIPSVNLIDNIGFLPSATHVSPKPLWFPKKYKLQIPIIIKDELLVDTEYDKFHNLIAMGEQRKVDRKTYAKTKIKNFIEKFF